jgi:hypothetical protein
MSATERLAGGPCTAPDFAAGAPITIDTKRNELDGGPFEIPGTSAALGAIRMLAHAFRGAGRPIVHIVRPVRARRRQHRPLPSPGGAARHASAHPGAPGSQLAGRAAARAQPHARRREALFATNRETVPTEPGE